LTIVGLGGSSFSFNHLKFPLAADGFDWTGARQAELAQAVDIASHSPRQATPGQSGRDELGDQKIDRWDNVRIDRVRQTGN
jgi:hypothetical protein